MRCTDMPETLQRTRNGTGRGYKKRTSEEDTRRGRGARRGHMWRKRTPEEDTSGGEEHPLKGVPEH